MREPIRAAVLARRVTRKAAQAQSKALLNARKRFIRELKKLRTKRFWQQSPVSRWNKYRAKWRDSRTPEYLRAERRRYKSTPNGKAWAQEDKRLRRRGRIPAWANRRAMKVVYRKRKALSALYGVTFHVDHVVPLRHPLVSGLHCEANLQLLADDENSSKSNLNWPHCPWEALT